MTTRLARWAAGAALVSFSLLNGSTPGPEHQPGPATTCTLEHPQGKTDPDAAATCGQCHPAFFDEWKTAGHAHAWVNPVYQEAIKNKKRPQVCHGCHIPSSVHDRLGHKPRARKTNLEEGVTCVACHKQGKDIHGPFEVKTDAHPSVKNPAFIAAGADGLCRSCHATKIGPVLPVGRDHKEYREKAGAKAKGCIECHMPQKKRHLAISVVSGDPVGEERMTRVHAINGPDNPEFCAKAFDITGRTDGADFVLQIANRAGHRIPGLKIREFVVRVSQRDGAGKELQQDKVVLSDENGLKVLETRQFPFKKAAGTTEVTVEVDHVFAGKKVATVLSKTLQP